MFYLKTLNSTRTTAKVAKTVGALMLLVLTTMVPLVVYAATPRALTGLPSNGTTTGATTYSGRAYVASVATPPTTEYLFDTGELPPSGGMIDTCVVCTSISGVTSAEILSAMTMGSDSRAESQAAAGSVTFSFPVVEGPSITASFAMAESVATCDGVFGSSSLADLTVGTVPITILGTPNQVVSLPGGLTATINEQINTSSGGTNSITVNALDITDSLLPGVQVIIAHADSDISCAAPPPHVAHDFVTGGGWIPGLYGGKATFGFVAGFKDDSASPSGHLTYIDHSAATKVMSTDVMFYGNSLSCPAANQRTFSGDAQVNGQSGFSYTVCATDNTDTGAGADTFSISVCESSPPPCDPSSPSVIYTNSGTEGGGNIEIHN